MVNGKVYKKGELIFCSALTNINVQSGYGIIIDIIDIHTNESFFEKEVITGHGELNTKVKIEVDIVAISKPYGKHFSDPHSDTISLDKPERFMVNPHDISKIDDRMKNQSEIEFNDIKEKMEKRRTLYQKYSKTLDEKIDIILK